MGTEISNKSKGDSERVKENGLTLKPVPPDGYGVGLPYAPENWPNPGDNWSWRVAKRVAITGHYLDRYLYLPKRLCRGENKSGKKYGGFASKLSVERYIRTAFPETDINAFFASFSWRIPAKKSSLRNGHAASHEIIPLPPAENGEQSVDVGGCKAGNKMCSSLVEQTEKPISAVMPCDICCSEPRFCRDCCCILCSKTIKSTFGGYHYIKCEAEVGDGYICGHIAHIDCALRTYMAGTVGGSIGLDAEYYCRRCDARTDLVSHVTRFLHTCESMDSRDEIEKILNIGICLLRGSQKASAKELQNYIELVTAKLKYGTCLEDIWKVEDQLLTRRTEVSYNGDASPEITNFQDSPDIGTCLPVVSVSSDCQTESMKLDEEIDQVLEALRKSQEFEYKLAEERLYAQKKYLCDLYQQLEKEKTGLTRHVSSTNHDDLLSAVLSRVNQIKQEVAKLKVMEEVAKGFGKTSKSILEEHYGLESD
ncbi:protein OBERON 1 isoform X2 [Ziziphus jujuba]|uniref:Protein OBERON 1 isoform X2 n=1 Tax=Ziziphus jujuba TaxID=326968 RepID=A0ABM4A4D8_ZIZJJ|nr:protein OBERON 1-like isoform X2 [Ziziphus jujuba var. spinosa]XP_060671596.1 protein OBERON 1 isoform X2 [Ziziphus jujuba]